MSRRVVSFCDECGWSGRYDSEARAAFAYRQHSCARKRRADRAAQRRRNREAATDRTPKPCLHKVARHQHGTHAAYVLDRCRCVPCLEASKAYERDRTRQRAYGHEAYVDARPAAEHLRALSAAGMGWKRAAAAAGIPESSVYPILYGRPDRRGGAPREKARAETVHAILAVPMPTVEQLGAAVCVDATGTMRRLQALLALGWSVQRVADAHGLDRQPLDRALAGLPIAAKTARAVREAYESIGDRRPPETTRGEKIAAAKARRRAREHQWAPPAMWDDDQLDDPQAPPPAGYGRPGECDVYACDEPRGKGMRLCWAHYNERRHGSHEAQNVRRVDLDEWVHLVRLGTNPAEAARRCGVTAKNPVNTIDVLARRADRDDVLTLIVETRSAA